MCAGPNRDFRYMNSRLFLKYKNFITPARISETGVPGNLLPVVPVCVPNRILTVLFLLFTIIINSKTPGYGQETLESLAKIDTSRYDSLRIDKIFVVGNRKTREKIIRRELDFSENDIIPTHNLYPRIKKNEDKIYNTHLFLSVNIALVEVSGNLVDVIIRVVERWYFFPIPVFELADRNFHDWWVNQDHDLGRLEYGLKLYQYNMRGMNETLKLTGQFGYTKKIQVAYSFPYIDRNQQIGLGFVFDYRLNKNINYRTISHKYEFVDSEKWLREQYAAGISSTYRRSFYSFHTIGLSYYNVLVNDTVPELNPDYFLDGASDQQYFKLYYSFVLDKRDINAYPLTGSYFLGKIEKLGIGFFDDVDNTNISVLYDDFIDLGKHFYFTVSAGGSLSFPKDQPYDLYNSMGIGRFTLHGYELYVIEGPYFVQNQYSIRKMLFQTEKDLRNIVSAKQFSKFHLALYLKSFFDMGYVKSYPGNELNKKFTDELIYGGGAGLDIVTFYDIVFRLEYSFNKAGESGFVFGIHSNFY